MAGRDHDALRAHLLGSQDRGQADGTVADHANNLAFTSTGNIGSIPAGTQHIRGSQNVTQLLFIWFSGQFHQGAVGKRDTSILSLRAHTTHKFPV